MGFRNNTYATVWSVETKTNTLTKCRISISKKNKNTGEYETDFSGYVSFVGTAAASKAAKLKEKDRIKLIDTDVSNKYDKEKDVTYTNFTVFSFELADSQSGSESSSPSNRSSSSDVDEGEVETDNLPF